MNALTEQTTTGYTLRDKDPEDRFTVDIKTDGVYGTPIFDLRAGTTSCPNEPDTQPRDKFQFTAPITELRNVPANEEAVFALKLSNISDVITDGSRSATLELLEESNANGAQITVSGSPYVLPITYSLGRLAGETTVIITVRRGPAINGNQVYSYEGLRFKLSASCGGSSQIITLSAFFQSPCSNVTLLTPEPSWITTIADNNQLPIHIGGYTLANLTNVVLEYAEVGTNSWYEGFTRTQAQLDNTPNGTVVNWNTTGLADGAYALRLKLSCSLGTGAVGTVYSSRAEGVIDRTRPERFGNYEPPASTTYLVGNAIGATYTEPLRCSQMSSTNVTARRNSNGQTIPVSVGCYLNQIVIVPMSSLVPYAGDVISVTLTGISDLYGNARTSPDIWAFSVGTSTIATGASALSVAIVNSPLSESAAGTIGVVFRLPQAAPNNILVNFGVAGSATYGLDYTTAYSQSDSACCRSGYY